MADQNYHAGTHDKNPVTSGYPPKEPEDVIRLRDGRTTVEVAPGSTAPKDPRTGKPVVNPVSTDRITVPFDQWAADKSEVSEISTSAGDTLGGATSKDVDRGIGKPIQGESSAEMHHDGKPHRKREHEGSTHYGQGGELR